MLRDPSPPRSASDGALLEAAAKIASSYDGVNFPPAHRHANIIAQAIRALAASEATKSDGGEERPASNPLSEVTHRPSDPKTSPELLALLERAKSHVMTPEDVYEQRRSFVRGMCPSDRDYTEWCADVDRIIPPLAGPSDTRPADVTVTPRVIDNDRDEIVVTLNGNELRGWSYSTEQERRDLSMFANRIVDAILATGLVPDESAIRADERERCAKIADEHSLSYDNEWNRNLGKASDLVEACEDIAATIRSGGGE